MAGFLGKLFGGKSRTGADALTDPDIIFARADAELAAKAAFAQESWGLGHGRSWATDLAAGTITFINAQGWQITAPVQVIGTFNTAEGTWMWGWDHPSIPEPVSQHARLVHDFGARYALDAMTTRLIFADETDAWTFTALACHLAGAQGGYRGSSGTVHSFMTFGDVTIVKDGSAKG